MKKLFTFILCLLLIVTFTSSVLAEVELITFEQLNNYEQLYDNDGKKGLVPVRIEAVVGKIKVEDGTYPNTYFDLWIKGEKGYGHHQEKIISLAKELSAYPHGLVSGQRVIYELIPYKDGSFGGGCITSYEIIEEEVDYKAIEEEYKATKFESVSYKKLMRNIEDYAGKSVCVEGIYLQDIGNEYRFYDALLMDDDANIYYFEYSTDRILTRLLLNDRLKLYGIIPLKKPTYEYLSLSGNRTVPYISVQFVDLLEDE